jgi:hypothetical protein
MAQPNTYGTAIEVFRRELCENLFSDAGFLEWSRNWSDSAIGKTVNWNESGATSGVIINRSVCDETTAQRLDVLNSFNLDEYFSCPTLIEYTEEFVINYMKRESVLREHRLEVLQDISLRMLFNWSPTTAPQQVRTTGTAKTAAAPGAAGTRNRITLDDILSARNILNKQNIPMQGRVMFLPSDMEKDMLSIEQFISVDYKSGQPIENGMIGTILGMPVFVHATGIVYDNAATPAPILPKADDSKVPYAGAVDDNQAAYIWHRDYVVRAVSPSSKVAIIDSHCGTEFSTTTIAGGSKYCTDERGIVAIIEQA